MSDEMKLQADVKAWELSANQAAKIPRTLLESLRHQRMRAKQRRDLQIDHIAQAQKTLAEQDIQIADLDRAIAALDPEPTPQPSPDVQQEDRQQEAQAIPDLTPHDEHVAREMARHPSIPEGFTAWSYALYTVPYGTPIDACYADGTIARFDYGMSPFNALPTGFRLPPEETAKDGEGDDAPATDASAAATTPPDDAAPPSYSIEAGHGTLRNPAPNQQEDSLKGEWDGWKPYPEGRDLPFERNGCWLEERFDHKANRWMYRYGAADASVTDADPAQPAPVSSTDASPVEGDDFPLNWSAYHIASLPERAGYTLETREDWSGNLQYRYVPAKPAPVSSDDASPVELQGVVCDRVHDEEVV